MLFKANAIKNDIHFVPINFNDRPFADREEIPLEIVRSRFRKKSTGYMA